MGHVAKQCPAEVGMEINGVKFTMEVAVADTLPMSVLLGTDAPIL